MLNIYFGDMEEAIYNTSVYFNNQYLDCWLESDFAKKVIKSIDKGTILSPNAIDTKVLGIIPTTKISGGAKTLLLVYNQPEKIFNVSTCGNNCAKFLLEIGKLVDVTVNLRHLMDFGARKFDIRILNTNTVVHNMGELIEQAHSLV